MRGLKLYEINPRYIKYLSQYQEHIFISDGEYRLVDINGTKDQQYKHLMQFENREIKRQKIEF